MAQKYRYRPSRHNHAVDAQVVGEALERIAAASDGDIKHVRTEAFVDYSRPEDSETHPLLEWDDSVAGEEFRKVQARNIIHDVAPIIRDPKTGEEREVRGWVNVDLPDVGHAYVSTALMGTNEIVRTQAIRDAVIGLRQWQSRYRELGEMQELLLAIDALIAAFEAGQREAHPPRAGMSAADVEQAKMDAAIEQAREVAKRVRQRRRADRQPPLAPGP